MIAGIAVLGKDNNPLYIRSFGAHDSLRFHFIVHTALDFIEDKRASDSKESPVSHASNPLGLLRV